MKVWPMGCKKIRDEKQLESLINDDNYLGQEKLDGVRAVMHVLPDGSLRFTTRGATLANPSEPIDITHRLPHLNKFVIKGLANSELDCELYDPNMESAQVAGQVNYKSDVEVSPTILPYFFDIIVFCGRELENAELTTRLQILYAIETSMRNKIPKFKFPQVVYGAEAKRHYLMYLLESGKEGIVFKNIHSKYFQGAKKAGTWYKYKKKDTVDVRIIGSKPPEKFYKNSETGEYDYNRLTIGWEMGWIGSIEFEEMDGKFQGFCSGLTNERKSEMSHNMIIKPEYIGRIMEVEYMEKTTDGNLRHPRFIRLREEIEKS